MSKKQNGKFWVALTLFSLIGQIAWVVENMYLNVFIYKMFNASPADISAMVGASAAAATVTTVLIGALSDRFGKRKVFICAGYILWGISILGFTLVRADIITAMLGSGISVTTAGVSLVIALDCIMTFFGSSANDAAFNAWLTDSTDTSNRGAAEGINAMMPLVAILVVFGGFMAFDLNLESSWVTIFTIIGAVVIAIGIAGIFIIDECECTPSDSGFFINTVYGFLPRTIKENKPLYFYLITFILFNISIQVFMPYLILYYEVSLGMTDYVLIMAPAVILASVVTALWGKVYDKKGFGFTVSITLLWLCLGYITLYLFTGKALVFIGSLFMMCGYLSGMAVFGAKIRDKTPEEKAGRLQGVRIVSQVLIPSIVGPFISKTVLKNAKTIIGSDGTESFIPSADIFLWALICAGVLILCLIIALCFKKPVFCKLETPFKKGGWEEYPRPQLKRNSYISLCGKWVFKAQGKEYEIEVPYPPESELSGVGKSFERFSYKKSFVISDDFNHGKVIIHFGAVDQIAKVYINSQYAGEHVGGYLPFEFDITQFIKTGENTVEVEVIDTLDKSLPYGKQRKRRGGMWYTPISGIWQSVWLESVPEKYIESIEITPSPDSVTIMTQGGDSEKVIEIDGKRFEYTGDCTTIKIDSPVYWTPENPHLYYFTLSCGKDRIESYFALRTVEIKGDKILLNGKPYFFNGVLDQGYYSDGIYTPKSPEGYLYDIRTMKSLGFNMLRKHIKIEPMLFYHYCDKEGIIVFQDMVNNSGYNYLLDTVLPTVGVKKSIGRHKNKKTRENFIRDAKATVKLLYNCPSVCGYTIFNEGWGQFDADILYRQLKELDSTRFYDSTSGWFEKKDSDVMSDHIYFRKLQRKDKSTRPYILSEFGGFACKIDTHIFNPKKSYGYSTCKDRNDFCDRLCALYENEVIPLIDKGLCLSVLTQLSDVEDEINGLVTFDRQVIKPDVQKVNAVMKKLYKKFNGSVR